MTPQNEDGTTSKFSNRQKVIAGAVVIVLLIIIWQIMGLFGGESKTTTEMKPAQPKAQMSNAAPSAATPAPGVSPQSNAQPAQQPMQPVKANLPPDAQTQAFMNQQPDQQKQYVDSINQLQMLRLQKDIDETKQSIAAAKLATATAEKNISDLFTKPSAPQPAPMSSADYAKMLGGNATNAEGQPIIIKQPEEPVIQYVVISVSMRLGHWTAVLGYQNKLYGVSVGDILPVDGSEVVAIGKDGVVLKKNEKKRRVSIVNSI